MRVHFVTGMRLGLVQSKVGLISILQKYEVEVCAKTPIPMIFDTKSLVLSPSGGLFLNLNERK